MIEIHLLWAWAATRVRDLEQERRENPDRGEVLPWVIITALLAAAAITVVAIIVAKAKSTANNVKTQ
jgi:hypothetical protein